MRSYPVNPNSVNRKEEIEACSAVGVYKKVGLKNGGGGRNYFSFLVTEGSVYRFY
jgi:hypothetical protein